MIVRFHNLGQIKETELDFRPLTVIIGPNNSNKTYVAYSLYGLWQALRVGYIIDFSSVASMTFSTFAPLNSLWEQSEESSPWTVQWIVNDQFMDLIYKSIDNRIRWFEGNLPIFFQDSSHRLFLTTHFEVEIPAAAILETIQDLAETGINDPDYSLSFSLESHILRMAYQPRQEAEESGTAERFRVSSFDANGILSYLITTNLFARPYMLPAERNAFIITYKVLANRRMKWLRDSQRSLFGSRKTDQRQIELLREAGEVRYPGPVEDFLDFLSDIELEDSSLRPGGAEELNGPQARRSPHPLKSPFARLADTIEKSIQNANKTTFKATALGGREIKIRVDKGLDIDLYNASSSIKQLAPLLLYLRYRAAANDLLIIDEPEMNLHPESQAKLLEVLAMLVNRGVKVLLTTHSPYLLAHLNNLVQAEEKSSAVKTRQAASLYLKDPQALLSTEQVSAYEMRDNQLKSLKDPDYGIRWDTLSDVSVDLQQKFFEIEEKGHGKTTGRRSRNIPEASSQEKG